jgi:hypothetical protein
MKILKNIELNKLSVYLPKSKTIVLSDIHIGYEEALNKQGILIPRIYFKHLYEKTKNLIKDIKESGMDFETLVINGDLKHEFGRISDTEWRHTLRFLDLFKDKRIILIKGNHDKVLGPIARKRNLEVKEYAVFDDIVICHGDAILNVKEIEKQNKDKDNDVKIKKVIVGHEHPAVTIQSSTRSETFKCFLIGKTPDRKQDLIVMPSYNEVTEGTNLLNEELLSPYLRKQKSIEIFKVVVYGKELMDFGKIKDIRKLNRN